MFMYDALLSTRHVSSVLCCVQFICDPKELKVVRTALEQHQMQVSDAKLGYIPHTFAFLTDAEMAVAGKLLEALSERPDVSAIYDNIQLQSST